MLTFATTILPQLSPVYWNIREKKIFGYSREKLNEITYTWEKVIFWSDGLWSSFIFNADIELVTACKKKKGLKSNKQKDVGKKLFFVDILKDTGKKSRIRSLVLCKSFYTICSVRYGTLRM